MEFYKTEKGRVFVALVDKLTTELAVCWSPVPYRSRVRKGVDKYFVYAHSGRANIKYIGSSSRLECLRYNDHKYETFDGCDYKACIIIRGREMIDLVKSVWSTVVEDILALEIPGLLLLSKNVVEFEAMICMLLCEHVYASIYKSSTQVTLSEFYHPLNKGLETFLIGDGKEDLGLELPEFLKGKDVKWLLSWRTGKSQVVRSAYGDDFYPGMGEEEFLTIEVIKEICGSRDVKWKDCLEFAPAYARIIKAANSIVKGGDEEMSEDLLDIDMFEKPTRQDLREGALLALSDVKFANSESVIFIEKGTAESLELGDTDVYIGGLAVHQLPSGCFVIVYRVSYIAFQPFKTTMKCRLLAARDCVRVARLFGRVDIILSLLLDLFSGVLGVNNALIDLNAIKVFRFLNIQGKGKAVDEVPEEEARLRGPYAKRVRTLFPSCFQISVLAARLGNLTQIPPRVIPSLVLALSDIENTISPSTCEAIVKVAGEGFNSPLTLDRLVESLRFSGYNKAGVMYGEKCSKFDICGKVCYLSSFRSINEAVTLFEYLIIYSIAEIASTSILLKATTRTEKCSGICSRSGRNVSFAGQKSCQRDKTSFRLRRRRGTMLNLYRAILVGPALGM
jgi:hypothetical protein